LNYPVVDLSAVRDAPVVFVINQLTHSHCFLPLPQKGC
jgi:hypothetical protein